MELKNLFKIENPFELTITAQITSKLMGWRRRRISLSISLHINRKIEKFACLLHKKEEKFVCFKRLYE